MEKYFNFNNEEYILPIDVAEDGQVTLQVNGQEMQFDSVQQLAENYATARSVATENLKNWTLVEDGDTFSFVLRAATAGNDFFQAEEVEEYPAIYVIRWGDDDDDEEYDDYDEDDYVSYYDLASDVQQTLQFMYPGVDEDGLTVRLQEDDTLLERAETLAANFATAGNGNFELGIGLAILMRDISNGELPENHNADAARQLEMAAVARRDAFPMVTLNVTTRTGESIQRSVTEPIRPTELVTKVAGKYVIVTR